MFSISDNALYGTPPRSSLVACSHSWLITAFPETPLYALASRAKRHWRGGQ
jgi:hypothetical protein